MNSRRMKRFGMSSTAFALFSAFAALAGGCSSMCDLLGCPAGASLSGSVVVAKEVSVVDFRFCAEDTCNEGSIDVAEGNARMPCASWDLTGAQVCLTKTSEPQSFALRAVTFKLRGYDPHDVSVQLRLVDHATGAVLLDETRIAKSSIWRHDECHLCWSAEATL